MKTNILTTIFMAIIMMAFGVHSFSKDQKATKAKMVEKEGMNKSTQIATFAGGCFWCTESDFEKINGVVEAISGYTGGSKENPTYKEVSAGRTDHYESIQVIYDPKKISYRELLDVFWKHIDPTDPDGQFVDKGSQYRSAIFYHNEEQKRLTKESRDKLAFDHPAIFPEANYDKVLR